MKKFYPFILSLLFAFNLNAQWEEIASDVVDIDQRVWSVKMVDSLTGWYLSDNWVVSTFIDTTAVLEYQLHKTEDGGKTWKQLQIDPFTEILDFAPIGKDGVMISAIYSATGENLLMRTFDLGATWDFLPHESSDEFFVFTHFFDSQNGFALGYDFLDTTYRSDLFYLTEDGGDSWTEFGGVNWETPPGFSLPTPKDTSIGDFLVFSAYSIYNGGGYATSQNSLLFSWISGDIWLTDDRGKNWKEIKTPFSDNNNVVSVHAIEDENNFMIATDSDFDFNLLDPIIAYFTNDGGITWKESILPNVNTSSAKYLADIDAYLIMGQFGDIQGTIITYDEGDSWQVIDSDRRIIASDFYNSKHNLGTFGYLLSGGGVFEENGKFYRLNIPDVTSAKDLPTIEWLTIAPNPATDFIQIQLPSLFDKPDVHYEIFDVSGRLIAKEEGIQSQLDISNLAVGKYSLKISTPSQLFMSRFVKI